MNKIVKNSDAQLLYKSPPNKLELKYPTIADLRRRARRRVPRFAFDYVDGAAGANETGMHRNAAALDAIEVVPRYGVENFKADMEVDLFGRRFSAPIAVAPMGLVEKKLSLKQLKKLECHLRLEAHLQQLLKELLN